MLPFPGTVFTLFHMVWSILFGVLALQTLKWKFLIGCWRISTKEKVVSHANTPNKMDHTMRKSMKNCAGKWCQKLCAFLFAATWAFGKMCDTVLCAFTYASTCTCIFLLPYLIVLHEGASYQNRVRYTNFIYSFFFLGCPEECTIFHPLLLLK